MHGRKMQTQDHKIDREQLNLIKEAVRGVVMHLHIIEVVDRAWML